MAAPSVRGTPSVRATPGPSRHGRMSRQSVMPDSPGGRSTITTASRAGSGQQMPEYEQPAFSLTPDAQRKLAALSAHNQQLNRLNKALDEAQATLTLCAGAINDRLHERQNPNGNKRKASSQDEEAQNDASTAQHLSELEDKTTRMTGRMEETMCKMIDGKHATEQIKESIGAVAHGVQLNANTQASTLRTRSQRQRREDADSDEDEDEDDEIPAFTPTDPAGGPTQAPHVPLADFKAKLSDAKTRYQSCSLAQRYAENNDFVEFKRVVHDARNPDGDVDLPHKRTWFPEDGDMPAPGVAARGAGDEDSDDDIAISRARISTKCPLTLREFAEPLTCKKCEHSFEKSAITELLRSAKGNVQCPVGGCRENITKADLHVDNVLLRKIKRIQRAKELEEQEADENGDGRTQRGAVELGDEDDEDDDVDAVIQRQTQMGAKMKREPKSSGVVPAASQSQRAPQSTAPIDLGESSEEDE